jgi:hypothetical protein
MSAQTLQLTSAQTGQLFAPEGYFLSVFDLTKELERLGIIEILELPSGSDCYRIIDPKDVTRVPKQPKGEMKERLGAIFFRRPSTLWSTEEIKAFRALTFDPAELALVEEFYRSEAGKEGSYTRTSLLTFLRHYPGEVDRARRWKETSAKKHCY